MSSLFFITQPSEFFAVVSRLPSSGRGTQLGALTDLSRNPLSTAALLLLFINHFHSTRLYGILHFTFALDVAVHLIASEEQQKQDDTCDPGLSLCHPRI